MNIEEIKSELSQLGVSIDMIGGNCPVQAEGKVGGEKKLYFRSRGDKWSLTIDPTDALSGPDGEWYYFEKYGVWPDAGWITLEQAHGFILKAVKLYKEGAPKSVHKQMTESELEEYLRVRRAAVFR